MNEEALDDRNKLTPHAGVVKLELDDKEAVGADELGVAARRIVLVDDVAVPLAGTFSQDVHVVTVSVHGVRGGEADAVHDDADGFGIAHVEDPTLVGEVLCADGGIEQDRVVEVAHVGGVVHVPDEFPSGVVAAGQDEVEGNLRVGDVHLVGWNGDVEGVVGTCGGEEEARRVDVGLGLGVGAVVCIFVVDLGPGGSGDAVVQAAASLALRSKTRWALFKSHPDSLGRVVTALDDDFETLSDSQSDHVGLVRLDGDKVVGDDGHVVSIDAEEEDGLGTVVDQAEQVLLASLELECREACVFGALLVGLTAGVVGLSVDKHVVGHGWENGAIARRVVNLVEQVLVVAMEPVRKHDGAEVDVPLASRRSVNDHGSRKTVQVLTGVVTVPPGGSKEFSANTVGERGARSDRTLADGRDAIVPRSASLEETVPVDRGTVVFKLVVYSDLDPITPVGFYHRAWELVVDDKHGSLDTVG